jgi:dipeptidyl aminopeptidase/acylaminoacyl peptidase
MTTRTDTATPATAPGKAPWIDRFLAPVVGFPDWGRDAPDRLVVASTESGRWQLWGWELASGSRRRVTDEEVGVTEGAITPDGREVVWLRDETGSEAGRYVVARFDGGGAEPLADGLPVGWGLELALGREVSVAAIASADGFSIHAVAPDGRTRTLHHHPQAVGLAGASGTGGGTPERAALSSDETLLCLEHSEHGDVLHLALRVIRVTDGSTVADLLDEGRTLQGYAWSPLPGDQRIAIAHERRGELQPGIWDVADGSVDDIDAGLDGLVEPVDWWPDGSALLLVQLVEGRSRLHRYDLASRRAELLPTSPGSIAGARVRPDGSVWYRLQDGAAPPRVLQVGRQEPVLVASGPSAPAGRPYESWWFTNPHGQRVHGFTVSPGGEGPHPLMLFVHGGPTWLDFDRWSPEVQAYVDAGFLVAMVNYRGSVGYGREWRDTLIGNIGWPEIEDLLAGTDDLVTRGLADPERAVIAGWSWGGYLTLLMHGMHPDRFRAGIAGVPVGDYAAGYEDLSPILQAYDRALLGGAPSEVPQLMEERSPISYVDRVKAPILFLAGRNDSRCPLRQVLLYTDRLKARSHPHELYVFEVGHASYDMDERIRQIALNLDFLARHVPGIRRLPGVDEHMPRDVEVVAAAA